MLDDEDEADDDGWMEMHELSDDERFVRAQLTLDGDTLTVSTQSEPRGRAGAGAPAGCDPRSGHRLRRAGALRPGEADASSDPAHPVELDPAIREEIVTRWSSGGCGKPCPRGGVTPIEAAADPTWREELERLLASFPNRPTDRP